MMPIMTRLKFLSNTVCFGYINSWNTVCFGYINSWTIIFICAQDESWGLHEF